MGSLSTYYDAPSWHPLPAYHLKAPRGWINDPCAPGYDKTTGTYHLFYQWNPDSCDWGNISWGHFTSRDGLHWEHNGAKPSLRPDQPYDDKGVFTGCFYPGGPKGKKGGNLLTVVYSSITALPIHWTIPYTRNCAGLALATSGDGGRTWQKSSLNPVLKGEPDGVTVTGFRDPVLAEWQAMDVARGVGKDKMLYGLVSGGIVGQGPNAFVYEVPADDLASWKYVGPLVDVPVDFQRPSHWTGDFGVNWECVNFMTLREESSAAETQMLIMGTEGGLRKDATPEDEDPHGVWAMWMGGSLKKTDDGVRLESEFTGFLDNGCFYAANSYEHPVSGKRIVWGWIKEEDLTLARRESKGWTGYLSLQRELFLFSANNVVGTIGTPLEDIPSFKVIVGDRGRTVQTLGIRPLQELQTLRRSSPLTWTNVSTHGELAGHLVDTRSTNWELEALIRVHPGHQKIGFDIRHNRDKSQRTSVYFSPIQEEIVVDRGMSNTENDIQKDSHSGPFTLLVSEGPDGRETEMLRLRIFSDGDVLEVFANDRFALSTVVYTDSRTCTGISWFIETEVAETSPVFESVSIWEGLQSIQGSKASHL